VTLTSRADGNEAARAGLASSLQVQQSEIIRINQRLDAELNTLRGYWGKGEATDSGAKASVPSRRARPSDL
jgi:hypothetical protein